MRITYLVVFVAGLACGLACWSLFGFVAPAVADTPDPLHAGLPWGWLAFGYTAQSLFMGRMLVQWVATEKKKRSVVPVLFWWLSLAGGLMLLLYFLRRGDPVGVVGQLFGAVVYARNLILIARAAREQGEEPVQVPSAAR
jgi:lipid-A-disaccharide synthase-like uncharacterized protein